MDVKAFKKEIHAALKIQRWFRSKFYSKTESPSESTDVKQRHDADRSEVTHRSEYISFGNQGLSDDVFCTPLDHQAPCQERVGPNPGYGDGGKNLRGFTDVLHPVVSELNRSSSSDESAYAQLPKLAPPQDALESLVEDALQSGTLQPGSSSKTLFGELLGMCRHQAPVTFRVMLNELGIDGCIKLRESCHSEVFRISGIRGTAVLKVVHIEYIVRHLQHLVSEVKVGLFLKDLRGNPDNRTAGFSELRDTYCIWDKYPSVLDHACMVYHSKKNFSLFGEDIRDLHRPYFVMCMSYAGQPLVKAQFDNSLQVRSVIEQVAMALAVGETAVQFEHRGLTTDHILVKPSHDQRTQYCLMSNSVFIDMHGVEASIVDFSMSRMCLTPDAQPLYSDLHRVADDKRCTEGECFLKIYDLVRDDLSKFRPWTNVIFLSDAVKQLRLMYQDCFCHPKSEAESHAWRDVCLWAEELLSFSSVTGFVLARVIPKAHSSSEKSRMDFYGM
ncbi:conserved hypothetical protein [Ixodes scapularis]|uniref:Serine/threonine-protein kinase haspin homolog n=1 Tax=Ixodes scapularis TaxID=6945 RepID=B7Q3B7_IXOSC|nr:conserved hypothetical protein [Ixodes scapularis]|eukprot:XP_002411215.1 conserved hypothetical protein [Ixodes scapularis]